VAPPETDKALATEYFEIRDRLGLSNEGFGGDDEGSADEDGEEEEE